MKLIAIALSAILYVILQFTTSFTVYESLSIVLFVGYLLIFVDNLGKRLVILDIINLSAIFGYLLLPVSGYHYFNDRNPLAILWIRFMQVPSEDYYSFVFPATIALILGLKLPVFFTRTIYKDHAQYMVNAKEYIWRNKLVWQGVYLVVIGLFAAFLKPIVPSSIGHVVFLLNYLIFVGVFYSLYSELPNKRIILIGSFGLLLVQSILMGMFGELIFMGTMTIILVLLGRKIGMVKKLTVLTVGILLIMLIQLIKPAYRAEVWTGKNKGSAVSVYMEILSRELADPEALVKNEKVWFNMYSRFNQGQVVSLVLKRIPARIPYANGETVYLSVASVVVPRFLWPDKIEAGGVYNFKRFLGLTLKGYSVGISPYGEGWGNYGKTGGIVFMFFFGLFFNFVFSLILKLAVKTPSLVLWMPVIFFYAVKIETDIFSMLNSLVKAVIFTWMMYKIFPLVFRMKI